MRFTCEQCGKRYTTSDVLQPGRTYRTKCKACGNLIVVKGTGATEGAAAPPMTPSTPAPTFPSAARPAFDAPSAPPIAASPPAAAPPLPATEPKYIDLFEGDSLDDLLSPLPPPPPESPSPARRKGAVPPPVPGPPARASSAPSPASPPAPRFPVPEATPTPVPPSLKQTRPPAYFGDVQPATAEPPPPPAPPKAREAPREAAREEPPPPRRGPRLALVGAIAVGIVAALAVGLVWQPWRAGAGRGAGAEVLPRPTAPVPPEPRPPKVAQPEPTPPPAVEPAQPSAEELARQAEERERQEQLAKAEQERLASLEKLERENAEKAARAEEARLARLEKLEREKAERAAKAEQARLARLEKLEKEKAEKAAKAEQARLARLERLEKEKAEKAAKAEQERVARLEREKVDREKAERDRAEKEKASRAEQERLAKLPVGLPPDVMVSTLAGARRSFDECVKNPSRGLDRPLEIRQVRLRFSVQPQGTVSSPTIDDPLAAGAPVGQCLKSAAAALRFPEFRGDPVQFDTPIALPTAPAPAATAAATGPVNVVVFTGPKSTRSGAEVGDTVYSERSDDAAITDHQFENGVVTYSGQVGFGKGSTYAGIGINVNINPEARPIDATRFKSVTFRLASPTTRSLRLRIIGTDQKINQQGCYPTTLIRITKELKDYTFSFKDFDPANWCGANGRTAAKTIPELVGFEVADINIQRKPTSFSVGTITLTP